MPYDPRQDPKYKNDKLLLALTHQESRFNPNAVSPTGARGLTQVLPSTARSPGFGIAPNPGALNDPEQNMAFGKAYLSAMQKRYKGDNAAALVAYNGGPGKADQWVASGKNDKVLSKETSNYYKSVLGKAGTDFSKASVKLPTGTASSEDDSDEETNALTGFSKLKKPGSKNVPKADKAEDTTDEQVEEDDTETEKAVAKVAKVKASKKEADDDDDEEDDDAGGKSGKSGFSFDAEAAVPKLKPFEPGASFKMAPVVLGQPKLQVAQLELDNPRDR